MRRLEADAYEQGGYFTAQQARAHRVSRQLIDHHVRSGRFERLRRGLYRIRGFPADEHDEIRRAWMAVGGQDAVLSHESALALLDLSDNVPERVHILVPRRRHGLRVPSDVTLHTHADQAQVPRVWRDGLPLTAPARTLLDVAGHIQPEQLEMAVAQAVQRGLLTTTELRAEAERRQHSRLIEAHMTALTCP